MKNGLFKFIYIYLQVNWHSSLTYNQYILNGKYIGLRVYQF